MWHGGGLSGRLTRALVPALICAIKWMPTKPKFRAFWSCNSVQKPQGASPHSTLISRCIFSALLLLLLLISSWPPHPSFAFSCRSIHRLRRCKIDYTRSKNYGYKFTFVDHLRLRRLFPVFFKLHIYDSCYSWSTADCLIPVIGRY